MDGILSISKNEGNLGRVKLYKYRIKQKKSKLDFHFSLRIS